MKGITICSECASYDMKKHRCRRGANLEENPRDPFYDNCPLPDVVDAEKAMEWISKYAFADNDEVYTNGSMLVPLFRVKQALIDKSYEGLKETTP